jgi:hypothetical protein
MKETYCGSCHCGTVSFEADIDLDAGTAKCNCSICSKARAWGAIISPESFRLKNGEAALSDYQFGSKSVHHYFCKHCGIRPYERGFHEAVGGDFYSINVACLEDRALAKLVEAPIRYADGRNNDWQNPPKETRHL